MEEQEQEKAGREEKCGEKEKQKRKREREKKEGKMEKCVFGEYYGASTRSFRVPH